MIKLLAFILLSTYVTTAWAYQPIAIDAGQFDAASTEVSLLNVGGSDDEPWMAGGHLVLRLHDDRHDFAFDWGVFNEAEQNFLINYLLGTQDFEHLVRPFSEFMEGPSAEGRSVVERQLALTPAQRMRLIDGLRFWARPENQRYRYKLLDRNCATSIRDLLAKALGSGFKTTLSEPWPETIRAAGLARLSFFPPVYVLATVAGGPIADRPGTRRGLFYLPSMVPILLADVPQFDDQGLPIAGTHLLGEPRMLLQGNDITPATFPWVLVLAFSCALPLLLGAALVRRWPCFARGLAGLAYLVSGFMIGTLGIIIDLLWGITQHTFTWRNANVGLFWPLDFMLVWVGFVYLRAAIVRRGPSNASRKTVSWLSRAHLVVAAAVAAAYAGGLVKQDLHETLTLAFALWGAAMVFSFVETRRQTPVASTSGRRKDAA